MRYTVAVRPQPSVCIMVKWTSTCFSVVVGAWSWNAIPVSGGEGRYHTHDASFQAKHSELLQLPSTRVTRLHLATIICMYIYIYILCISYVYIYILCVYIHMYIYTLLRSRRE